MNVLLLAALTSVGGLPHWTHPDTEVSTNVLHRFSDGNASEFRLTLSADVSPTNAVTIAFGADRDGDGTLGLDETRCSIGWDCGVWFQRGEIPQDAVVEELTTGDGLPVRRMVWPLHRRPLDWDIFRVIVRGADSPVLSVTTGTFADGLTIRIK